MLISDSWFGDDPLSALLLFLALVSDDDRLAALLSSSNYDLSQVSSSISDDEESDVQTNGDFHSSVFFFN